MILFRVKIMEYVPPWMTVRFRANALPNTKVKLAKVR